MGVKKFIVALDDPAKSYSPGDILNGKVILSLSKPKRIRKLLISFFGVGKVKVWESFSEMRETYRDEEVYLQESCESMHINGFWPEKVPSGEHTIPFRFRLPGEQTNHLPSTFYFHNSDKSKATIRYEVKSYLVFDDCDLVWDDHCAFSKKSNICEFEVRSTSRLDNLPSWTNPVIIEDSTEFTQSCLGRKGYAQVRFSIPRRGFTASEPIPVSMELVNGTNKLIAPIRIKIYEYVTIKVPQHSYVHPESRYIVGGIGLGLGCIDIDTYEEDLTAMEIKCKPHTKLKWWDEKLSIQSATPVFGGSGLVSLRHEMEVKLGSLFRYQFPITIGTHHPGSSFLNLTFPSLDPMSTADDIGPPPSYRESPPPSYRQCVPDYHNNSLSID